MKGIITGKIGRRCYAVEMLVLKLYKNSEQSQIIEFDDHWNLPLNQKFVAPASMLN